MELTFLGTSSMVPTKERNVLSHFLDYKGECFLIDCGEGTQRQMNKAGINRLRVRNIMITHWHGDHVSGLLGLLQTIGNAENPPDINIFGPVGTKESIVHLMKATRHTAKIKLNITELNPLGKKQFLETKDYYWECIALDHLVPSLGYSFIEKDQRRIDMKKAKKFGLKEGPEVGKLKQGKSVEVKGKKIKPAEVSYMQKGKKITFLLDTAFCKNGIELAQDSDLLVCESTYHSDLEDKAAEYKHMTAKQAADIASQSKSKQLILTHFSQRYTNEDVKRLLKEAKETFSNTKTAKDFMVVKV